MRAVMASAGTTAPADGVAASGAILFARYAFGPNRLGYCGPDAAGELLGEASSGGDTRALRELARGFEGAWPYLELIARANNIPDALDRRVVEAYWLGSPLVDRVTPSLLNVDLEARFRPRLPSASWRWLAEKPAAGAVPVHAFHVLDVFPRIGLLRSGSMDNVLEVMDACRIRWGRVLGRDGEYLLVDVVPLELVNGRLRLGNPRTERVQSWLGESSFVADAAPGDLVSVHWSWACDRLSADQLQRLMWWTRRQVAVANQTI